jgi:hypothetical protein
MPWPFSSSSRRSGHSSSRPSSTYSRSSSYYKRRPRDGYISRLIHKLKHLFRELWYYARKNPVKIFFLLVPLISGGALAAVARQFGVKLPDILGGSKGSHKQSGGYYGSKGYDREGGSLGGLGGLAGSMGGMGGMGNVGSLMSVAKAFL